ncbi:MAG: response regulator transcription factor [Rhizobium sp.]|nr:MAG: response regulator transcription factor [Rhizobium sp.]
MSTAKIQTDVARSTGVPDGTTAVGGILLVDDHELVRLGFRALVQSQASTAGQPPVSVFEAHTLADALFLYGERHAEIAVVVLDLNLPDTDGLDGLMAFRQKFPAATVVVLSGTDHPETVKNAMALGAVSFFSKSGDLGNLVGFVHICVLHGAAAACERWPRSTTAFAEFNSTSGNDEFAPAPGQTLSRRQLQILQWLLQGKSNREIGELAFLSEGTVKNHVSTLLLSFGVRSRAQLISKLRA